MKILNKSLIGLAGLATIGALSAPASATIITVTSFAQPNPTTVHIQSGTPNTSEYVYAGGFNTTNGTSSFVSWCVDIVQNTYLGVGVNNYTLVNAASVSQIGAARADALGRLATQYLGQVNNATTSAAFQLAAWEIVFETAGNPYNMSGGNFLAWGASDNSIGLAQTWLNNLPGSSTYSVSVWSSPTHQDLAVFTNVPEPATLGLLAIGLIGAGFAKKRKAKAAGDSTAA
ncbi:MAG: PEP-CTERM sorting domain-containing protein [Betaproteobacteria bacterium]